MAPGDKCGEKRFCCFFKCARRRASTPPRPQGTDHPAHPPNSTTPDVDQNSPPPALRDELRDITLDDLDMLVNYIDMQIKSLDSTKASSSLDIINEMSSQFQQRKEAANSFVQSLPQALTKEIVEDTRSSLVPLLTTALGGLGGVHWVGMGLLLISWSIENIDQTSQNCKDYLDLLKQVVSLLFNTRKLLQQEGIYEGHHLMQGVQGNIQDALECAIICSSSLDEKYLWRFLKASSAKEAINRLQGKLNRALEKNNALMLELVIDNMPKFPHQSVFDDNKMGVREVVVKQAMEILEANSDDIVGLCLHGMGGIGKSTAGMSIFSQFQAMKCISFNCCRVEMAIDITDAGLPKIQKEIIEKLCKHSTEEFSNVEEGKARMKKELSRSGPPLFLYIDNVMHPQHLVYLLPDSTCFPRGSRILITTRIKSIADEFKILKIEKRCIEVEKLNPQAAKDLFWQQFEEGISTSSERSSRAFRELEEAVLHHCDGLPLALILVGRDIANSEGNPLDLEIWKEVIEAMKRAQPLGGENKDPLYARIKQVSIDQLHPSYQRSFVDIAFFCENKAWYCAERLVGKKHMDVLLQRALVRKALAHQHWQDEYTTEVVNLHDVMRSIGVQMAESVSEKELRIKGNDKLRRNIGSLEKVVGLKGVSVHAQQLERMGRLRVLIDVQLEGECKTGEFMELVVAMFYQSGDTLLPFRIGGCPKLKALLSGGISEGSPLAPVDFEVLRGSTQLEILVIDCCGRTLENLEVIGCLTELRVLRIYGADTVEDLPVAFESLAKLEQIMFAWCTSLRCLPESIMCCTGLNELVLRGCSSLQTLPEKVFTSCTNLA